MKKIFGIILIIIGLICIPQVFSPSAAETIGGLIGVSLFTFLPAYFLLRRNSKANKIAENQSTSKSKLNVPSETYWQNYKRYYLSKSFEIEKLTGLDFSTLSNIDAREKVESLERWSNNTNTPISQLKQHFLNTFIPKFTFDELPEVLNSLPQKRIEEANIFNISEQNTSSYWMIKWLDEYINTLEKNELDDLSNNKKNIDNRASNFYKNVDKGVDFINMNFKLLSDKGRSEAFLFCSSFLVNFDTEQDYNNDIDIIENKFSPKYKAYFKNKNIDVRQFVESRVFFYPDEIKTMSSSSYYTPMLIYNAFYINPLTEHPDKLDDFKESPKTLFEFQVTLFQTISILEKLKNK